MRLTIALLAGAMATLVAATAQAAPSAPPALEIKDAVAQVTVIPENRADVRVDVIAPNARLPLKVRATRGRTIIDGGLTAHKIRQCRGGGPDAVVRVAGVGAVPGRDMPQVVIRAPVDVDVSAGGAVFGAVGRSRSLTLGAAGCGDWTVANVVQTLRISLAGTVDAKTGSAGQAKLRVAGSGDMAAADVHGRLDVDIAGSGNVRVKSVAGPLDAHLAGSGDATVEGGRATAMTVSIAGSGNVVFHGTADTLDARIAGSGDVRVRQVRGRVRKAVIGSGAVRIG
jgi:hypothetical protein